MQFHVICVTAHLLSWVHSSTALFLRVNETAQVLPVLPTLPQSNEIFCFEPAQQPEKTSVEGCRRTLNYLRGIPTYRLKQSFEMHRRPKIPWRTASGTTLHTPPFLLHAKGSDCAVRIDTLFEDVVDEFSFEEVRRVATDVVEDCQSSGGHGGVGTLGQRKGWEVQVVGYTHPPDRNRTVVLEGFQGGDRRIPTPARWPIRGF